MFRGAFLVRTSFVTEESIRRESTTLAITDLLIGFVPVANDVCHFSWHIYSFRTPMAALRNVCAIAGLGVRCEVSIVVGGFNAPVELLRLVDWETHLNKLSTKELTIKVLAFFFPRGHLGLLFGHCTFE